MKLIISAIMFFVIGLNCLESQTITMIDVDGNDYNTVTIGSQIWITENLKVTKYNDGEAIPLVVDKTAWDSLKTPGFCWYNNDKEKYGNICGAFYNWYTVNTNKLCPIGWHVPTDAEWKIMTDYLGGDEIAGGKLKETGTTNWLSLNTGATNETGFTALPCGYRYGEGSFQPFGDYGNWWTHSEMNETTAKYRYIYCDRNYVSEGKYGGDKRCGFSVRCIKD